MNNQEGIHTMTAAILNQYKAASFEEGVKYALNYLNDLIGGLEETDIWAEFMREENN